MAKKNKNAFAPRELRTLDQIKEEHRNEMGKLADARYRVYVYNKEAKDACERLMELNREASERAQADAAAKPVEATAEVKGE